MEILIMFSLEIYIFSFCFIQMKNNIIFISYNLLYYADFSTLIFPWNTILPFISKTVPYPSGFPFLNSPCINTFPFWSQYVPYPFISLLLIIPLYRYPPFSQQSIPIPFNSSSLQSASIVLFPFSSQTIKQSVWISFVKIPLQSNPDSLSKLFPQPSALNPLYKGYQNQRGFYF